MSVSRTLNAVQWPHLHDRKNQRISNPITGSLKQITSIFDYKWNGTDFQDSVSSQKLDERLGLWTNGAAGADMCTAVRDSHTLYAF